jgi:hypothetical protein
MVQQTEDKYIFSDSYRTKDLIWDAYFGFVEHFNNYQMHFHMNMNNPIILSGLERYANDFYYETYLFYEDFNERLGVEDLEKINNLFEHNKKLTPENFIFLRKFFNKFMIVSGIKQIVKERDQMGAFARSQSEQ